MSSETKSIYYHFISLKKLLTTDEVQQLKPLEDTLKVQGKLLVNVTTVKKQHIGPATV